MTRIGEWGDPPPAPVNGGEVRYRAALVDAWVDRLKARPGEWLVVGRWVGRNCSRSPFVKRGCVVTQRHEDGWTYLWAMWPGEAVVVDLDSRRPA